MVFNPLSQLMMEPGIGDPLESFTWDQISQISKAGTASQYFHIGDRKSIKISGKIGDADIASTTLNVYIIDINHDDDNRITFQCFISDTGTSLALTSYSYGRASSLLTSPDGTKVVNRYFDMNHYDISVNPPKQYSNAGGWKLCDMRCDILGSTNAEGVDAPSDTATNPRAETLMSTLPEDLRKVMQPITVWTDNNGAGMSASSNVTKTVDYLPLLSEYEVFGTRTNANSAEQTYQTPYSTAYPSYGIKTKNKSSDINTASYWWLRSPYWKDNESFCIVDESGNASIKGAAFSYGLAPIFKV